MPDVYLTIANADAETQERLAEILELRAADPDQRVMLERYTARLELPDGARVLEVGSGTGAVARYLATLPGVGAVVGVDPSPVFVERARTLADDPRISFHVGDARELPLPDAAVDCVVFHTVLCHVDGVEQALAEARRVCRPGGTLAVFDGDYATATVATSANDPLQACMDATIESLVHDPWLLRRLPRLIQEAGFQLVGVEGHAYTTTGSAYMTAFVERGADALAAAGVVDSPHRGGAQGRGRGARGGRPVLRPHRVHERDRPPLAVVERRLRAALGEGSSPRLEHTLEGAGRRDLGRQLGRREPADVLDLFAGLAHAALGNSVVVGDADPVGVVARDPDAEIAGDPHRDAGFLERLAHGGVGRVLVRLAEPARRAPEAAPRIVRAPDEEQPAVAHDERAGARLRVQPVARAARTARDRRRAGKLGAAGRAETEGVLDQKNSPSRSRFRPLIRLTFRFRVQPTGSASS